MLGKEEILKEVKKASPAEFKYVKLPDSIELCLDEDLSVMKLHITKPTADMQTDHAAFSGWILCFKAALGERVKKFVLSWENEPTKSEERNDKGYITPSFRAYQRFLFRVTKFCADFSDIASIDKAMDDELKRSLATEPNGAEKKHLFINSPDIKIKDDRAKGHAEGEPGIEREMVKNCKHVFSAKFDICAEKLFDNQLPVGLFLGEPSNKNQIMPAKKAAIDIWGIDNSNAVHIFELKAKNNKKVGIISELLFYVYVIAWVQCGAIEHNPENTAAAAFRKAAMNNGGKPNIKAHFLVPYLHPLITPKVIDLLNSHLDKKGMSFDAWRYDVNEGNYEFKPYWDGK